MSPPPAAGEGEEDLLEVRCAGCMETLEVERGLTEFFCPDCSTPQALPPELMPPPPPRRRRALPIPPAPARHFTAAPHPSVGLPCGVCGALLSVPLGLARWGCPVCGAELAVDAERLRQHLLSTAASPLVPVSVPTVDQAREGCQEYPASAVCLGHIQRHPNSQLVHVVRCRNKQLLSEYPIAGNDICTDMSNKIDEMHCHRTKFLVAAKTVSTKRRQVETLNYATYQADAEQPYHSVHAEHTDYAIHVGEAQNESFSHAIHKGMGHVELIKEKTVVRHRNHVPGTTVGPTPVCVDKRQVQTLNQIAREGQGKAGPPKLLSTTEQGPEHFNDSIQTEEDETEMGQLTARLAHKSTKKNLTPSSNKGLEHRLSKRLAKQSATTTYNDSHETEAVCPSQTISDSQGSEKVSHDSSNALRQHKMPHRSSNEADNHHVTTHSACSIPDMSDPESFARHYSKICPPEVRTTLERSTNLVHAGGKEKKRRGRGPTLCLKVWTMPEGERIPVSFNDQGQPIGIEAVTLSSVLGQLARDVTLAPLTYTDWRHFPKENKNAMWHLVNFKFIIPPIGEIWVMQALGKKWKDWKGILKHERYDVHETDEERLADRDPRVPEEQWKLLVAYWGTEKAKAASARSRNSQPYQPVHRHRTGTKSYARIQEEERQNRENLEDRCIHIDP